jgi:hypothetical protein
MHNRFFTGNSEKFAVTSRNSEENSTGSLLYKSMTGDMLYIMTMMDRQEWMADSIRQTILIQKGESKR